VIKLLGTPLYALLQYCKVLPTVEKVHDFYSYVFSFNEKHKLLSLENCYKVVVITEVMFETLP